MDSGLLTINKTAKLLGISIQTLRRWDDSGKLSPVRRKTAEHRHYLRSDVENFIRDNGKDLDLFKLARNWEMDNLGVEPFSDFYCKDVSVFQARLTRLENELGTIKRLNRIFPLLSAIAGEIGNNSFDHNLGNWLDISGIFFAWDTSKGKIVLADRGQGVLATLKKVKPELENHQDALRIAFTEIISGRAPEYRGNGLKFVKEVVFENKISLFFQTGDAQLTIKKNDSDIGIKKVSISLRGCLALIEF
ncbi:MAG: helix-turn-helix domain-containing protein [archaeon]